MIGLAAALTRPNASAGYALPTLGGALVGAFALYRLVVTARQGQAAALSARAAAEPLPPIVFGDPAGGEPRPAAGELRAPDLPGEMHPPDLPGANVPALREPLRQPPARRAFLVTAGVTVFAAAVGEVAGRQLTTRRNVTAARSALRFPRAAVPAPPLPRGVNLPVPGISSFITPNSQFYRVDTALFVPQVDPSNWQLRIHGMVAREITADLR